jgi:hypothetical protein
MTATPGSASNGARSARRRRCCSERRRCSGPRKTSASWSTWSPDLPGRTSTGSSGSPVTARTRRLHAARGRVGSGARRSRVKFLGFQRQSLPRSTSLGRPCGDASASAKSLSNFLIEAQAHGLPSPSPTKPQGIAECFMPGRAGADRTRHFRCVSPEKRRAPVAATPRSHPHRRNRPTVRALATRSTPRRQMYANLDLPRPLRQPWTRPDARP